MKTKIVAAIAVVEGLVLLLLGAAWGLNSIGSDFQLFGCDGQIYATAPPPDGKRMAYAFERDCGATTGFSSFVVIRDATEKLDLTANLVEQEIVFQADGDYHPNLKWNSKNHLQISFPSGAAPSEKEVGFQSVKSGEQRIEYQGLTP
jgi:hypothetical protein